MKEKSPLSTNFEALNDSELRALLARVQAELGRRALTSELAPKIAADEKPSLPERLGKLVRDSIHEGIEKHREAKADATRRYKISRAPSIEFVGNVVDDYSIEGVELLEAVYSEQVEETRRRVRISTPDEQSIDF